PETSRLAGAAPAGAATHITAAAAVAAAAAAVATKTIRFICFPCQFGLGRVARPWSDETHRASTRCAGGVVVISRQVPGTVVLRGAGVGGPGMPVLRFRYGRRAGLRPGDGGPAGPGGAWPGRRGDGPGAPAAAAGAAGAAGG